MVVKSLMIKKDWCTKYVLGVKVDCISYGQVLKQVGEWWKKNKRWYIVTPNSEMVVLAQEDKKFKQVLNKADISIPDGMGLVWVLRLRGVKLKRVTGAEVMNGLIEKVNQFNKKVFLLGGYSGVAESAKQTLIDKYPKLKIEALTGPLKIEKVSVKQNLLLRRKINSFKPDLLLVAFGHQKQEKWIYKNLKFLNVKAAMGVGGSFDYLVKPGLRAPKIIQSLGFEWLWRLYKQPWRIKRQLKLIKFLRLVFKN